jgi:hypothetical protein
MADAKGLDQIPIRLTPEQARIIAAYAQLNVALALIKYPKSNRWEERETAISVLEALASFLSANSDEEVDAEFTVISKHTELLQDLITHFRQASWGTMDRRLAPNKEAAAGAAHDDGIVEFKRTAMNFVNIIAKQERAKQTKGPVIEARLKVAKVYQELGLTYLTNRSREPQEVTPKKLGNWAKRPLKGRRARAK